MKKEMDMLHGPLASKILLFAIPLACTGILQQLFNAADVMVIGRFVANMPWQRLEVTVLLLV